MSLHPTIQFLKNHEIDREKWDHCITGASNRLIYARAFYLDNMAAGWNALAGENYEWVFPITAKRKYGFTYLHQPPFCQQLGVFAKPNAIVPFNEIVEWLKTHYRFWEINCNYTTDSVFLVSPVKSKTATNFILNLSQGYKVIYSNYHKDLINNLKRSRQFQLKYQVSDGYNKGIELFIKHYADRLGNIKARDYKSFGNICAYTSRKNMLICREVVNGNNELLSTIIVFRDGKRLYNLMNITTAAGRQVEANHFLLDSIIREYGGQQVIFDFEGSDVPGIKKFYKNFGAEDQPFYMLKYNNLPWPIRHLKE